jgi:hypothetical protein
MDWSEREAQRPKSRTERGKGVGVKRWWSPASVMRVWLWRERLWREGQAAWMTRMLWSLKGGLGRAARRVLVPKWREIKAVVPEGAGRASRERMTAMASSFKRWSVFRRERLRRLCRRAGRARSSSDSCRPGQ